MSLENGTWDDITITESEKRCTYFPRDQAQDVINAVVIATAQMVIIESAISGRNSALAQRLQSIRCSFTNYAVTMAWGKVGPRCLETEEVPGHKFGPCE